MRIRLGGDTRQVGVGGKIVGSLFFAVFLGLGLWFCSLLVAGFVRAARVYAWSETACVLEASGVEEHPEATDAGEAYVVRVRYHYRVDGEPFLGVRLRPGYSGSADVGDAERLAARYPAGGEVRCYVDPDRPAEATLERPSLWGGLAVLFPLIFVAIGGGGIVALWWRRPPAGGGESEEGAARPAPISGRREPRPALAAGCLAAFFAVFLFAGLGFFVPFFGLPAWRSLQARSWLETPCAILHSAVRSHAGDESTTYSVDVLYSYRIGGREYKSSRYTFFTGSSGGSAAKEAAVARYPAGGGAVCYVNPADPTDAVLVRSLAGDAWFGLFPLIFVAVGAGGIAFTLVGYRRQAAGAKAGAGAVPSPREATSGPLTLDPKTGPIGKLLGISFAALFWNGIVGVFVWRLIAGYQQGQADGCLTAFLIPFVLIGLLLLASVPYQFLALFNPRPLLTLATGAPRLGEPTTLEWRFRGAAGRIRRLRITVEGREEATFKRGSSTSTEKETFTTLTLVDSTDPRQIAAGTVPLTLPADTMHSFAADHNKIVWTLKVAGEIGHWPDVGEEIALEVRPLAIDAITPAHPRPLSLPQGGRGAPPPAGGDSFKDSAG